jgi:fructosamine-3-kinase
VSSDSHLDALKARIAAALGNDTCALQPLHGGCVAAVYRAECPDGRCVVVKAGAAGDRLDLEGWMLTQLRGAGWPAPAVLHGEDDLLLIEHVAHDGAMGATGEEHAASLLARLHGEQHTTFGLERDTLIAGLPQANPVADRWVPFFAEHRLLAMAREAQRAGALDGGTADAVERLAGRLHRWLDEPEHASLIHGDLWGGNLLFDGWRLAAVIDPACYRADAEIELAFSTLFSTFGERFFARYEEARPLAPGFFEARRDLYNLYPLLVHVRLFGGHYLQSVRSTLRRFGAGR